ncbi:MAG: hypothetical protein CNCCGFBP_01570 [Fimbriimonadaceae bacterium]|nr:hypothetical protein [Fimbriimonadaceae bacterium]
MVIAWRVLGLRHWKGALAAAVLSSMGAVPVRAEAPLPTPLTIEDVARLARDHRPEVSAARARANAARQRPAIVGGLDDPMLMPAVEAPFMLDGVEASLLFEQDFPLSPVLSRRADVARAEARALALQSERVGLDVTFEAMTAFHMLWERRENARILEAQTSLARQIVAAAAARYGAGAGSQTEVLRGEAELARLEAARRSLSRTIAAAEAMLAATLGAEVVTPIPELVAPDPRLLAEAPAGDDALLVEALPEVLAGDEEIRRWKAEVGAMRSMYTPMARLQTGPVYSSEMGAGWMLMFGVSLPIWTGKLDAGVEEAVAMVEMAKADRDAMRRMAASELAQARHLVAAAHERYQALVSDVLPRMNSAADAALASYASGQAQQVSVLEATQTLWSVERDAVMARMELGLARARLDRAIGAWRTAKEVP